MHSCCRDFVKAAEEPKTVSLDLSKTEKEVFFIKCCNSFSWQQFSLYHYFILYLREKWIDSNASAFL
jgi:hypothetical protein